MSKLTNSCRDVAVKCRDAECELLACQVLLSSYMMYSERLGEPDVLLLVLGVVKSHVHDEWLLPLLSLLPWSGLFGWLSTYDATRVIKCLLSVLTRHFGSPLVVNAVCNTLVNAWTTRMGEDLLEDYVYVLKELNACPLFERALVEDLLLDAALVDKVRRVVGVLSGEHECEVLPHADA